MPLEPSLNNEEDNRTDFRSTMSKEQHGHIEQLDELKKEQVIEGILDIMEEKGLAVNKFRSIEEVEKYLKQEANGLHSEQLNRIRDEHNYASSSLINATSYEYNELSDEGYVSPCEGVVEPNPNSKIYDLRKVRKFKEEIGVNK